MKYSSDLRKLALWTGIGLYVVGAGHCSVRKSQDVSDIDLRPQIEYRHEIHEVSPPLLDVIYRV
jgi:hypothetical protein